MSSRKPMYDLVIPHNMFYTWRDSKGLTGTYNGTYQTASFKGYVSRTKNSDRNWKVKVAKGIDATTNYSRSGVFIQPARMSFEMEGFNTPPSYEYHRLLGGTAGGLYFSNTSDDALRDLALKRLKSRLATRIGSHKAMVPIVELRELRKTITGLAGLVNGKMLSYDKLLRTKRGLADFHRYLSQWWLNFNFGVNPLINDVADSVRSIEDYLNRAGGKIRVTGTASKDFVGTIRVSAPAGYHGNCSMTKVTKGQLSYKYIAGVDLSFLTANDYSLSDHLNLGLGELPSVGWELLPFSWVIDYFSTVGAYLEDTFVLPSGSTKYVTLNTRYILETDFIPGPPVGGKLLSLNVKPGYASYYSFSRQKLSTLPHASLRFKTADELGRNAVVKLLNLTSVLSNLAGRSR